MTDVEPASVARGFLFADLRNYSAWVESHGDHAAATLLRAYRGVVRQAVAEFNGAEIKTEGDSFYVVFGSPSAAVKCGLRIVELAAESQAAAGRPIPVGVGVHAGETVMTDEGYVGSVVNVAARVCAQAAAGELLVTDAVRSLTRTYLNATFVPRGRRRLKGISEPIALHRVTPGRVPAAVPLWRRLLTERPSVAAMLAIGVLVVAALIGGALVRESGAADPGPSGAPTDPGPSGVPTIVPTMTTVASAPGPTASAEPAFPSEAEADLIALAPAPYREGCARADPADRPILQVVPPGEEPPPGEPRSIRAVVTAGVACDMGGIAAPDRVWYWDVIPNRPAEGDNAQAAIARHAGIVRAPPGTCRDGVPALERWAFGSASGQLVCYETDEGDAVVLWVFDDAQLFGKAVRDDLDMAALLDWWEDVGRFAVP